MDDDIEEAARELRQERHSRRNAIVLGWRAALGLVVGGIIFGSFTHFRSVPTEQKPEECRDSFFLENKYNEFVQCRSPQHRMSVTPQDQAGNKFYAVQCTCRSPGELQVPSPCKPDGAY